MVRVRQGQVSHIQSHRDGVTTVTVELDGEAALAINYDDLTGPIRVGDHIIINTTAQHLRLGTAGSHFVMGVIGNTTELTGNGHIMKCRYTPSQTAVLSVEEEGSPHHQTLLDGDLGGTPVVVATLHSMLAAAAVTAKQKGPNGLRVVYIMTDGAALPAKLSRLVGELKQKGYLDDVITYGQAFGGDYEAVTLYSALLAARQVCNADLIVVAMGPGVVGTGTTWGTTALEQGTILDGVGVLAGRAIAAPRLSFADPRERHRGLSHHALTALGRIAARRCEVAIPLLQGPERDLVYDQLLQSGIRDKHTVKEYDAWFIVDLLEQCGLDVTTMGRTVREDPGPFASAAAAVLCALESTL